MVTPNKSIQVKTEVEFETGDGFVRVAFPKFMIVDGMQFTSAEQLMIFMVHLMEKAREVWPDDPAVQYYAEED